MSKFKNSVERLAYNLKFWQALAIFVIPSFSLIVLLAYMAKMSVCNISLIILGLFLFALMLLSAYIAILQTAYAIIKEFYGT